LTNPIKIEFFVYFLHQIKAGSWREQAVMATKLVTKGVFELPGVGGFNLQAIPATPLVDVLVGSWGISQDQTFCVFCTPIVITGVPS